MISRRIVTIGILGGLLGLAGCSSKFKRYHGPTVTRLAVFKDSRKLYIFHNETVLAAHEVELGFAPVGHKEVEGDGKTPEGRYFIDRRNPNSSFHLSLGISYPNDADRKAAAELGESPGGDIFIHGQKSLTNRGGDDWTAGCISVTNDEMEDIYAMVPNGVPIDIYP
ncbi:MAG: L,D-transpeptidase family protein [Paracoccaceae bacterium]|nr:L,D-transpeptidase family protein [Paracoccaceae bacterium]